MQDDNAIYYQYQKELNYQVFLKFDNEILEARFDEVFKALGFEKVDKEDIKGNQYNKNQTRVIKVSQASPKVAKQIDSASFSSSFGGIESLSPMGRYNVYKFQNVGMMIFGNSNLLWELGVKSNSTFEQLLAIVTRCLGFALASSGIVGFWGVPVDEGFVVMSQRRSEAESVFVDIYKGKLITRDGVKDINSELQILRLDPTIRDKVIGMDRESLLSFLSNSTCYFSYSGFEIGIKDAILEISQVATGLIYPEVNFKPREAQSAA